MQFRYANSIDYRENKLIAIIFESQIASCNNNGNCIRASTIHVQFSGLSTNCVSAVLLHKSHLY